MTMTRASGSPPRDNLIRALLPGFELRAAEDGGMPTLVTSPVIFNRWTEIDSWFEGNFMERIAPGATKKTIKENRSAIKVLFQHGSDPTVGDKPLGPISDMRESAGSLDAEVPLLDTSYVRDLIPGLEAGLYGASFRFRVMKEQIVEEPKASAENPRGLPERTIQELRLFEFGPVTFPAYEDATAGLRSDEMRSMTDDFLFRDPERLERFRAFLDANAGDDRTSGILVPRSLPSDVPEVDVTTTDEPNDPAIEPEQERESALPDEDALTPEEPVATTTPTDEESRAVEDAATERAEPTTPNDKEQDDMQFQYGTVEEMRARQDEISSRMKEIHAEWAGQDLPDDARGEYDSLKREHADLDRHATAHLAREADLLRFEDEPTREDRPGPTFHTSRPGSATRGDIYDLSTIRVGINDQAGLKRELQDRSLKSIEQSQFPKVRGLTNDKAREHIADLIERLDGKTGEFSHYLLATGSPTYKRAFGKMISNPSNPMLTEVERAALAIASGTGNLMVPYTLDPTIIPTSAGAVNPLRTIARVETINNNEWRGVSSGGVTASYDAESTEVSDDTPSLVQPTANVEKAQAFVAYSIEWGQDAPNAQAELARMLTDAKDRLESDKFVNGAGHGSNEPEGVVAGLGAGQYVYTAAVGAFAGSEDIYALDDALDDRYRDNARFLADKAIYNKVRQFDTQGGADLWVRLGEGLPPELIGYPAHRSSAMSGTVAADEEILLFGDFEHFLIVDRVGMSVELLPHLLATANNRPSGQRGLYAFWRNTSDILVADAFRILKVDPSS